MATDRLWPTPACGGTEVYDRFRCIAVIGVATMSTRFGPAAAAGSRSVKVRHPSYPDISISIMNATVWLKAAVKADPDSLHTGTKNQP